MVEQQANMMAELNATTSWLDDDDDAAVDFETAMSRFLQEQQKTLVPFDTTAANSQPIETGNRALDIFSTIMSYVLLFGLIFGLSATVELKDLKAQLRNKFAIVLGCAMQFLIMPVLGFIAVVSLSNYGFTEPMGVTLLVVTSSPGGSYSNWWCSTFNADLALSVAMTTVSSLLSVFMLPLNLFLYTLAAFGTAEEESLIHSLDYSSIFVSLTIVLLAIVLGLYCGYRWDNARFHTMANRFGGVSGLLLILFSIFLSSGADGSDSKLWNQDWPFYVGVAFPCLVGISLANIISRGIRLKPPETVAIAIECCYQNTGIATSVAITMFDDPNARAQAVAVPLFYGVVEAIAIAIYCVVAWKCGWTKAPASENICVVMTKTYEVSDNDTSQQEVDDDDEETPRPRAESGQSSSASELFDAEPSSSAELQRLRSTPRRQSTSRRGFWGRLFGGGAPNADAEASTTSLSQSKKSLEATPNRPRLTSDMTADTTMSVVSNSPAAPVRTLAIGTVGEDLSEGREVTLSSAALQQHDSRQETIPEGDETKSSTHEG